MSWMQRIPISLILGVINSVMPSKCYSAVPPFSSHRYRYANPLTNITSNNRKLPGLFDKPGYSPFRPQRR